MTKPLDMERFRMLADAYGARLSRWPPEEQEAAMLSAALPDFAEILREAEGLDGILDGWKSVYPSAQLVGRTLQSGSQLGIDARRRFRIWWAGIGLAAALSGAVAGSLGAASMGADDSRGYSSTLFGDVSDQED